MKEIVIPIKQENKIDLSEINKESNGVIICYNDSKNAVGYIQHNEDGWEFTDRICYAVGHNEYEDQLNDLIKFLIDKNIASSFQFIEFEPIKH